MWTQGWRDTIWGDLGRPWDIVIIGGGITGAGILREAAQAGLRVLLLEGQDFASGTSSRSSKLVHGGLRYLQTHKSERRWSRSTNASICSIRERGWSIPWVFSMLITRATKYLARL
jgi:glycerol-3-phosphate dehydrogenase